MASRTLGFSSTVFRKKFGAGMTVRNYRDKEVVFSQGDTADAVFYIQSGTVKLTVASTRRKKAIIAVLLRGSFFGEGCLGGQSQRISTARSICWEPVELETSKTDENGQANHKECFDRQLSAQKSTSSPKTERCTRCKSQTRECY